MMQNRDEHRLNKGMNKDHSPDDQQKFVPGDYIDALNMRIVRSDKQHDGGVMESIMADLELEIRGERITYYDGEIIGASFLYEGFPEVRIGNQIWMQKNWDAKYPGSKVYDDNEENREKYGGLYSWNMIQDDGFAPPGWRVPTEDDVEELFNHLGGELVAGGKMKDAGTTNWMQPNTDGDNLSGFTALPGGMCGELFRFIKEKCAFWLKSTGDGELTDLDGNVYTEVVIGDQVWIVESLKVTQYADGTPIPNLVSNEDWLAEDGSPGHNGGFCWHENDRSAYEEWGAIYNWWAYTNQRGLAYLMRDGRHERGWRVPSVQDWSKLLSFIGGAYRAGSKLRAVGLDYWNAPNFNATDEYGFRLLGISARGTVSGDFLRLGDWCMLACSSEIDSENGYMAYTATTTSSFSLSPNAPKNILNGVVRLVRPLNIEGGKVILAGTSDRALVLRSVDKGVSFLNQGTYNLGNPISFTQLQDGSVIYMTDQGRVINHTNSAYGGVSNGEKLGQIGAVGEVIIGTNGNGKLFSGTIRHGHSDFVAASIDIGKVGGVHVLSETNALMFSEEGIFNWTIGTEDCVLVQAGNFTCSCKGKNGHVYAGDINGHIWESTDGAVWSDLGAVGDNKVNFIFTGNHNRIIFSCNVESISYTDNWFASTTNVHGIMTSILCGNHVEGDVLVVGDDTGYIWRSDDNGNSWVGIAANPQHGAKSINCLISLYE